MTLGICFFGHSIRIVFALTLSVATRFSLVYTFSTSSEMKSGLGFQIPPATGGGASVKEMQGRCREMDSPSLRFAAYELEDRERRIGGPYRRRYHLVSIPQSAWLSAGSEACISTFLLGVLSDFLPGKS